ncbi:MAG: hypothetical protein ACLQDL_03485 [Spirochaetia bacterium]
MPDSAVRIPGPLRLIHGETATLFDVLLVYAVGIVFGLLALLFAFTRVEALPAWKALLLFVLAADVSGGAMAGFTAGTDAYYGSRPGLRWGFIFLHFIQPGLLFLLFAGKVAYWIFLYAFTVAAAALVNIIPGQARQQGAAAALVVIGIVILLPIGLSTPFLAWFAPVYMLKLILGFAVRRFPQPGQR